MKRRPSVRFPQLPGCRRGVLFGWCIPAVRVIAGLSLLLASGCSELDANGDNPSMSYSTGQYSRGYRDGMREAMQSWVDDHAGWAWLWMMDRQYATGYERGWADGRRKVELEAAQEQAGSGPDAPIMNE